MDPGTGLLPGAVVSGGVSAAVVPETALRGGASAETALPAMRSGRAMSGAPSRSSGSWVRQASR